MGLLGAVDREAGNGKGRFVLCSHNHQVRR